ncbi:Aldo keto reductase [Neolentinus lepideus HHB14362 ss-1]|uniref:Aldo keto reductase n=1 Tax=Neolentinus lepideus HHB14362 ss-1 TaxID=1314782 RepID=A0A165TKP3_9AGAM|nr:Aldo keto reductase [Neolentinus lepideus HHB14362 ss-1]
MPYVRLGQSGLKISKIIVGMMSYCHKGWESWVIDDEQEAIKHVKTAYEAGINAFDTANIYSNGLFKVILGKGIRELKLLRDKNVVMTKLCGVGILANVLDPEGNSFVNQHGLSRKVASFDSVKHSLERLQLDYIDILQCKSASGPRMQALHDVVKAGYVRYIGMIHVMQNYAINNNLTPFISMLNHYNVVYREEEREMMPTLKHFGVGAIPWPLEARTLTARGAVDIIQSGYMAGSGSAEIVKRVEELAKKKGVTMAQISAAWVMSKDCVAAPISRESIFLAKLTLLSHVAGAVYINLTPEETAYLKEPYKPREIFGHGKAFRTALKK